MKRTLAPLHFTLLALAASQACGQTDNKLETIVVSGLRASAQSSVAVKKNAVEVVDAITAEDVGKLPDPNVAETLTRIPGVQGYRYGGEGASPVGVGSGVTIRGLSGQTGSQVNGRAYFTAGSREFNIESAIPGMIAGIDVYKNPTAEHVEGGIGGLVNIRTRKPSEFKSFTASLSTSQRWNDMARKADPELFGLVANRFDLGGGQRIGVLAAGVYQKSTGRSDSTPANGGATLRRVVRADTAEYATLAAANSANDPSKAMAAYVGRTDVSYLASVPTLATSSSVGANTPNTAGLTAEQIGNIIAAPAYSNPLFEETIKRTRKGLSLAADYRASDALRFYAEYDYTYYQYNQNYRALGVTDGANVQNLQLTPFNLTEGLANRNSNGGSDDVLVSKRLLSGSFLNSTFNTTANNVRQPYETGIAAGGVEWRATERLDLKADVNVIKATKRGEGPFATTNSAPGVYWTVNRVADGTPHTMTFSGPDVNDPKNYVFNTFSAGTHELFDDKGYAGAFSGAYRLDEGFISKLKFGARLASQQSLYTVTSTPDGRLTTDGLALAANGSNAINVGSRTGLIVYAPTNGMGGTAGYAGGFPVYDAEQLTGDQARAAFPASNISPLSAQTEILASRRFLKERTLAGYVMGEFSAYDDRLRGNFGVRVVQTHSRAVARVANNLTSPVSYPEVERTTSYTNVLPSVNVIYDLTDDTLLRLAYGKGLTRAPIDQLNPSQIVNQVNGTGTQGNAELKPLTADSVDVSFEKYFNKTNYAALGLFNKQIKGFVNGIAECQTVATAPAYSGTFANGCSNGQYAITRSVNAESGYVRGVELSGQWFFGDGLLKNFGAAGSYTYVTTSNPINFGTAQAPRIVETPQPMQSKHNFSLTGLYEDSRLSARVVYTWRSESVLFGVSVNPIDGRYIGAYGILDGSLNYKVTDALTLTFNASNLTNKGLDRFVGEPGAYQTGIERQHYLNGRTYAVGLRYKFD
ncbi:TonB-dependent receptor [Roseateles sp.]|uniref:TonB-dependent receptor n=1 Tax=Roseateles sp. TaxID=1971397 RepID=UPI0039EB7A41